jgi:hypothetical protein
MTESGVVLLVLVAPLSCEAGALARPSAGEATVVMLLVLPAPLGCEAGALAWPSA